jgi:uncharacterized protein YkwD
MWKRLCGGAIAAALIGSLVPATAATAATGCWQYKPTERRFALLLNRARARQGVPKLHLDPQLSKVARRHSWEMRAKGDLYHTPLRVLGRRITRWRVLAENIGVGSSVRSLHRAFMGSAFHKANILLAGFRHVGVGVQRRNGKMWVTVVFEAASNPGTRLPMPSC